MTVNYMPILTSWIPPGTFKFVFVLKQRIANDQIKLVAQVQEMQSIVVTLSHSMSSQSPPHDVVISNSGIKVTKNDKFVISGHSSDGFSEFRIEVFDIFTGRIQCGSIDTKKGGVLSVIERKAQHHNSVRHTQGKLIQPLG